VVQICEAYKRRNVDLQLYLIPTDAPCFVFMAVGIQKNGEGPSVVTGLGADFSAARAAAQALLEVGQVRPAFKQRLRQQPTQQRLQSLLKDFRLVEELEDHDLLYSVPESLSAFEFLLNQPVTEMDWSSNKAPASAGERLQTLISFLKSINSDLIYYNLTPPDLQQLQLYTARAILPGFQPIHFGWKNLRAGGNRLYQLPVTLGLQQAAKNFSQLSQNPHPLA
jgi:ribosomal protein S12 methylthiotransferase accessory factor